MDENQGKKKNPLLRLLACLVTAALLLTAVMLVANWRKLNFDFIKRYFTYRADCAPQTGNWITDPVVQIYNGSIHCNYAHSILSQWAYYPSQAGSAEAAYQALLPYITACGAQNSLRSLKPLAP